MFQRMRYTGGFCNGNEAEGSASCRTPPFDTTLRATQAGITEAVND